MRFTHSSAAVAVAFFLSGVPVGEARTSRVKRWVPSDPQAFEVELGFDPVGRYVATIGMGKPFAQAGNFSFLLSTSAPYTGVAAVGCETCASQIGQAPTYNISKSSSASRRGTTLDSFSIGGGSMSGALMTEDCSLDKVKGSEWAYDNQTIVLIQKTEGILGKNVSGFVGFGRSTGNDSYVSGILNSQGWKNATFAFAFNQFNTSDATQSAGSLTVREINPNLFTGDIYWQPPAKVTDAPKNMPADWSIKFDSYKISFESQTTTSPGGVAIIDPYFQEVRFPSKEAVEFFNKIPAKMTNDSQTLSWNVPCDQEFTLSITIKDSTYRMKNEQLISLDSTGTVCTSLVKGWADPVVGVYLFGAPFATTAYIAYNAQQDQSGDQIGVAPRVGNTIIIINQGVPTVVLVAAIVGSVCGVGFIITVMLFFLYHRRRQDSSTSDKDGFKVVPFTGGAPPNSATPMLSSSTRQTGYVLEQGPIDGEPSEGSEESPLSPPQNPDIKAPILPPNLTLVRQSEITEPSVPSPEPSPHQDVPPVVRPLPPLSASLQHSFYGERVPSVVIPVAPELGSQRHQGLEPEPPVPPPPYSQPQANARAVTGLATLQSPLRDGH